MVSYRIQEVAEPGAGEPRRCSSADCFRATREGKPFCTRHIEGQPYVQELLARLAGQRGELDAVRRRGAAAVDPDGLTAQELLRELAQSGARSVKRLARDLGLDVPTAKLYVQALVRRRAVRWVSSARVGLTQAIGQAGREAGHAA